MQDDQARVARRSPVRTGDDRDPQGDGRCRTLSKRYAAMPRPKGPRHARPKRPSWLVASLMRMLSAVWRLAMTQTRRPTLQSKPLSQRLTRSRKREPSSTPGAEVIRVPHAEDMDDETF